MSARILVIEDNPDNLDLMTDLLEAYGHTVLAACDGPSGVATALEQQPDLILCDLQLPGFDGFEVARRLRTQVSYDPPPLIAVTAYAMGGDCQRALSAGFDGYIAKPISPPSFVGALEAYFKDEALRSSGQPLAYPDTPAEPSQTNEKPHRARILVVDDSEANRNVLVTLLEPQGYSVIPASTASAALAISRLERPDLILCDLHLRDGSEYALINALKADPELASIPFVFLTATTRSQTAYAAGLERGADKFLFRPVEAERLLAEIDECLRGRQCKAS